MAGAAHRVPALVVGEDDQDVRAKRGCPRSAAMRPEFVIASTRTNEKIVSRAAARLGKEWVAIGATNVIRSAGACETWSCYNGWSWTVSYVAGFDLAAAGASRAGWDWGRSYGRATRRRWSAERGPSAGRSTNAAEHALIAALEQAKNSVRKRRPRRQRADHQADARRINGRIWTCGCFTIRHKAWCVRQREDRAQPAAQE